MADAEQDRTRFTQEQAERDTQLEEFESQRLEIEQQKRQMSQGHQQLETARKYVDHTRANLEQERTGFTKEYEQFVVQRDRFNCRRKVTTILLALLIVATCGYSIASLFGLRVWNADILIDLASPEPASALSVD